MPQTDGETVATAPPTDTDAATDETAHNCEACGDPLPDDPNPAGGRPRRFCNERCREKARRDRAPRRAAGGVTGTVAVVEDLGDRCDTWIEKLTTTANGLAAALAAELTPAGVQAAIGKAEADAARKIADVHGQLDQVQRQAAAEIADAKRAEHEALADAERLRALVTAADRERDAAIKAADLATAAQQKAETDAAKAREDADNAREAARLADERATTAEAQAREATAAADTARRLEADAITAKEHALAEARDANQARERAVADAAAAKIRSEEASTRADQADARAEQADTRAQTATAAAATAHAEREAALTQLAEAKDARSTALDQLEQARRETKTAETDANEARRQLAVADALRQSAERARDTAVQERNQANGRATDATANALAAERDNGQLRTRIEQLEAQLAGSTSAS